MTEIEPRNTEQQPFSALRHSIETIPEITDALHLAANNPVLVQRISSRYSSLLSEMAEFDTEDFAVAGEIRSSLMPYPDQFSASTARLVDVRDALGDRYRSFMSGLFAAAMDDELDTTQKGLSAFIERLEKGHQLKVQGHAIGDGDEESAKAIWGHTFIEEPEAMLHFLLIHYLERVACAEMQAQVVPIGSEKDFFLNGMIDAIIMDQHQNYDDLFRMLATEREQGGVGWKLQQIEDIVNNRVV